MKKQTAKKYRKLSLLCFYVFLISAVINMVVGIIQMIGDTTTSFPWYTPIVFVGMYYSLPLILIFLVYLFFKSKEKKLKE